MSRLNYHHLYYFWRVALSGNLTQVAKSLHVSQSALSAQIKQLEHNLDIQLFERVGRQLKLTPEGSKVLSYADDIFKKGDELELFLKKGAVETNQHLSIGVLTNLSRNFIEHFVSPLLANSNVSFSLSADNISNLLNGLASHEYDLVLTNVAVGTTANDPKWHSQLVSRQPLAIVGPTDSIISNTFPTGYESTRWVLPSKHTEIRKLFNALCATWQYTPDVQAETDDMAMLRLLARDSGALAVLPEVVVKDEIAQGKLCVYQELPNAYEHFYAITIDKKFLPSSLIALLQQQIQGFSEVK